MIVCLLVSLNSRAKVIGDKSHKVLSCLFSSMTCFNNTFVTNVAKQVGHYNRHLQIRGSCKRKDVEHCRHCQKAFAKGGSGLENHACQANALLLPFNMDLSADRRSSVRFALQELQKLSKYQIKQLGLADLSPVNVAVATLRYLHFTPMLAQNN